MRIAICTDIYAPQLSGVADSIELLVEELKKRGHTVRLYAPALPHAVPDPTIRRLSSYAIPGSAHGLVIVVPFGAMRDMREFKPDIIHTHTFSTAGFVALYAAWRLNIPLVGTDHTFPADYLHYVKLNCAPFRYLVRKFAAWYYSRCAYVTAPSKSMLDELVAYGMTQPMKVISNHIPQHIFRPLAGKTALKNKYGIGERAVLIFGRIASEKNLDAAVSIFADVAARIDAELVFIGGGPYESAIRNTVSLCGLSNRVKFLGVRRGEELVEAINACDVFLITSMSETQSMTTLQSMACGLPVVVIQAGGLPEYVEDNTSGFVIPAGEWGNFADRIVQLLTSQTLAKEFGEAGRAATARFSPEAITSEFEEIYATVGGSQFLTTAHSTVG
jgi:1,2-diacylglycerol 3-alpha-glucosyltransferase